MICLLTTVFMVVAPGSAADTMRFSASPAAIRSPDKEFTLIDLATLIPQARTNGERYIFAPRPVKFRARLAQAPSPQKTDYLKKVLGFMGLAKPPRVGYRVGLGYGGDKPLPAYVEDATAARMQKEAKEGQELTFYAYHVYNYRLGPALLVVSFE